MKLEEMADLLDGLAATLEKHLGKTAVNDLRALGDCLRKFSGETVAAFCNFTVAAREGRSASPRGAARTNEAKIADLAGKIRHFLDHRRESDFAAIRQIVAEAAQLKMPEIKTLGERVDYHLTGRTKAALVSSLENWLSGVKTSAEQSSFRLTGVGG
jgi:hypothetical protein